MTWQIWALMSAAFAAMTAVLAKVGVQGINSDFATFIRTIVILIALALLLLVTGQYQRAGSVAPRNYLFLVLSGLATGASWVCYFRALKLGPASLVAPIDKLSVVMVALLGVAFLGEKLGLRNWVGIAMIAGGSVLVAIK
jgi:transporter family protein